MTETQENLPLAVSNTGPLISIFQSDSLDIVLVLFGSIHTSEACLEELKAHDWGDTLNQAGTAIISHKLTDTETQQAQEFARRIAAHPASKDPEPENHLGEAEVMVLVQRPEFAGGVLLLDELAAHAVATALNMTMSGFAGVLLLAVNEGLLTADEVKKRLERCRQAGTHYSIAFINQIFKTAKAGEK